jgi:poly-beta-1,6-N-acetyl-D-glucosamine synthase
MMVFAVFYLCTLVILITKYGLVLLDAYGRFRQSRDLAQRDIGVDSAPVSIVICVRNESINLKACIDAIYQNDYDRDIIQLIVVDDHSTDSTKEIIETYPQVTYLLNPGIGKKQAQANGIDIAKHNLILCTDGDTIVDTQWIASHVYQLSHHQLSTGLVVYTVGDDLISDLQVHDNIATMCLTAYGITTQRWHVANGANMSFHKSAYITAHHQGRSHSHISSGDDVFLIKNLANLDPSTVNFMDAPQSTVRTVGEKTWMSLWNQRKRWASKTLSVKDTQLIVFQGLVFCLSISILVAILAGLLWLKITVLTLGLSLFLIKMIIDYRFLSGLSVEMGYGQRHFKRFWISSAVYLCYIVALGIYTLVPKSYVWKERTISET